MCSVGLLVLLRKSMYHRHRQDFRLTSMRRSTRSHFRYKLLRLSVQRTAATFGTLSLEGLLPRHKALIQQWRTRWIWIPPLQRRNHACLAFPKTEHTTLTLRLPAVGRYDPAQSHNASAHLHLKAGKTCAATYSQSKTTSAQSKSATNSKQRKTLTNSATTLAPNNRLSAAASHKLP